MNNNYNAPSELSAIRDSNRIKAGMRKWKPSDSLCSL